MKVSELDLTKPITALKYCGDDIPVANLEASNIKQGVEILGVQGTLEVDEEEKYVRPSDWLTIPTMDGTTDEVYILVHVSPLELYKTYDLNKVTIYLDADATIDWGDGTSDTATIRSSTSQINAYTHSYNYDNLPSSSWTEHSFGKQALIHIYGARGDIKCLVLGGPATQIPGEGSSNPISLSSSRLSSLFLEVNGNTQKTEMHTSTNTSGSEHNSLEIFKWKGQLNEEKHKPNYMSSFVGYYYMFSYCRALRCLELPDTTNITKMTGMFYLCQSLRYKDLPMLNTLNVTDMSLMFGGCYSLTQAPYLDTRNVTNMSGMFSGCISLSSVPQYNTSNVTTMASMFSDCRLLQDVPVFDTRKVTSMNQMFALRERYAPDLNYYSSIPKSKPFLFNTKALTDPNAILYRNTFNGIYTLNFTNVTTFATNSSLFGDGIAPIYVNELDCSNLAQNPNQIFNANIKNLRLFNLNPNYTSAMSVTISNAAGNTGVMRSTDIVNFFNSLATNVNGYSRTIVLGTYGQNRLTDCYVKNSGELYTAKVPTSDSTIDANKTYYTYDYKTDTFTQATPDFSTTTVYYELKTATWNRYDICESTDTGAMLALDFARNIKGYTIS